MTPPTLRFSRHARDRLLARGLDVADVEAVLGSYETVEDYEDGATLVLGRSREQRPLHLVIRDEGEFRFVITIYEPDPTRWDASFTRRIRP